MPLVAIRRDIVDTASRARYMRVMRASYFDTYIAATFTDDAADGAILR